jgi:cobaltochelatase CobT
MSEVQAALRRQQRTEQLCLAAIRALSGQRDLHFRGGRLHRGWQRLPRDAPHLHPAPGHDDFSAWRGAADGLALRLRLSDESLHRRLAPAGAPARVLFGLLEQFRVESLAFQHWPGVQRNLQHCFERWTSDYQQQGLADSARGILLFTVAQVCRSRVMRQPLPEALEDLIESTRAGLGGVLGPGLATLRRLRHDQAGYAAAARPIATAVAALLERAGAARDAAPEADAADGDERAALGFLFDHDVAAQGEGGAGVAAGQRALPADDDAGYRIFTTAYDREARAGEGLRREPLDAWRQRLDQRLAAQGVNLGRLAQGLQAVLSRPSRDDWVDAQEEGLVDGRRLALLVASPTERRLFRRETRRAQAAAAVTVLIDCSGSMRPHIEAVATLADLLARALGLAEVPCEILGFSTAAWNGGRARRDWQRAGRPPQPGRLNETLHLVFKDAQTPWRQSRRDIAALLRPELLRESVDGEALQWAANRLRARDEPRKLLIVVSDGCPMDGATGLANDASYLDRHLRQVAARIEAAGDIELSALGVGLDLSPCYGRSLTLDPDAALGPVLFIELLPLLAGRTALPRAR